ncbi:unnamed protein product [Brachionus calyciflorus]|uniref:Uncharacterized protein n=1 Tax=Brachionus calyciflorus TaxID=104777 RepID=A0A814B5T2_9BILA|nr:unnamed protein product [Brachionus calyciflorus]
MVNQSDILTILILNITKSLPKNSNSILLESKDLSENISDLKYKVFRESIANNNNNNYYFVGVLFLACVLGVLVYVNFCYENFLNATCSNLFKIPCCCCVRLIFKKRILNLEAPQVTQNKTKRTGTLLESPTSTFFANEKKKVLTRI